MQNSAAWTTRQPFMAIAQVQPPTDATNLHAGGSRHTVHHHKRSQLVYSEIPGRWPRSALSFHRAIGQRTSGFPDQATQPDVSGIAVIDTVPIQHFFEYRSVEWRRKDFQAVSDLRAQREPLRRQRDEPRAEQQIWCQGWALCRKGHPRLPRDLMVGAFGKVRLWGCAEPGLQAWQALEQLERQAVAYVRIVRTDHTHPTVFE
jgi:hypothetical protein